MRYNGIICFIKDKSSKEFPRKLSLRLEIIQESTRPYRLKV